ncbi:hypothetical protein M758_2G162900 [Ceratodon purpureus]|nr:hypothetical protein M758_2G162900 [Ceratodon purpureus]
MKQEEHMYCWSGPEDTQKCGYVFLTKWRLISRDMFGHGYCKHQASWSCVFKIHVGRLLCNHLLGGFGNQR